MPVKVTDHPSNIQNTDRQTTTSANSTNPRFCIFILLSKTAITSIKNKHWIRLRHVTHTVGREDGRGRKTYFSFLTNIRSRSRTMKKYLMRYFANGWLKTHSKYSYFQGRILRMFWRNVGCVLNNLKLCLKT